MPPYRSKYITPAEMQALRERGYLIGEKIGSGTFANVFIAEHHSNCRKSGKLACKLFDFNSVPPQYRQKFFPRELKILMAVTHPNIICMHSIQQIRSKVFIFMRYAENGDLLQYTQNFGPIDEEQCRSWFRQIVSALQYLHGLNIAHRDLKCENILLSKNYNAKLADFGFARECVDSYGFRQLSLTYCGSAAYTAPEIIVGRPYNPMISDVWSLGVILFILLNGRMPFDDSNLTQLLQRQVCKNLIWIGHFRGLFVGGLKIVYFWFKMNKSWMFRKVVKLTLSNDVRNLVRRILEPDFTKRIRLDAIARHRWVANVPQAGDQFWIYTLLLINYPLKVWLDKKSFLFFEIVRPNHQIIFLNIISKS